MAMAAAVARRLLRLLSSRPNPKPASLSSCSSPSPSFDTPATAGEREGDPLSWRLLRLRSPGAAAAAIDRWAQERGRVSRPDLQRAVSQLRRARRYGHALEILSWMDSRKEIKLLPLDHAARLDLIAKVHGTSQAEEYYNKLPNSASREAASFPLLHCYVAERNVQKAESFMASLQSIGLPVDPHSFNEMMKLYVATFFKEMVNDGTIEVGWSTYCTLANIFMKHGLNTLGDSDGVMRLWEASKCVPGRIPSANYMSAILCLIKVGDIDRAEWIFGSWEVECRKHDVRVSNVLLGAYVRNGWIEKAEKLHLHMLEKGGRPNYKTWEILVEGFVQSRQMDKAVNAMKKALSLMKGCHWRPPLRLVEAIATFFEEQGNTDDANRCVTFYS
ncbi:hypothetical protein ZWY2020_023186 [Hordeum vulgare]|nr:hypothetical protein ZWY2020_023186 [Hordeum vulgare]